MTNLLSSRPRIASTYLFCAFCAAHALRADVTIRYETDFKLAPGLEAMAQQASSAFPVMNSSATMRIKDGRAYSTQGGLVCITDLADQQLTLIDPEHKTYARMQLSQFTAAISDALPQASSAQMNLLMQALASIKSHIESRMTGRTDAIQGVQAEEREIEFSMELPPIPALDVNYTGPGVKLVIQIWTAKPDETLRVPAIREITGMGMWQKQVADPVSMMERILEKAPGLGDLIEPLVKEMRKSDSMPLRIHTDIYTPILAAIFQKMATQGQALPSIDPNAPIAQMTYQVAELSSAPVDAALFEVPKDYTVAPVDTLVKAVTTAGVPEQPKAETASQPSDVPQRIRVGGNVQQAKLISQAKPVYPPEAKAARISGHVLLNAILGKDGTVQNLSVVSGHPLLIPAATDAVKQWVYQPTLLNGKRVEVATQIDVNFVLSGVPAPPAPEAPAPPSN